MMCDCDDDVNGCDDDDDVNGCVCCGVGCV